MHRHTVKEKIHMYKIESFLKLYINVLLFIHYQSFYTPPVSGTLYWMTQKVRNSSLCTSFIQRVFTEPLKRDREFWERALKNLNKVPIVTKLVF